MRQRIRRWRDRFKQDLEDPLMELEVMALRAVAMYCKFHRHASMTDIQRILGSRSGIVCAAVDRLHKRGLLEEADFQEVGCPDVYVVTNAGHRRLERLDMAA